MNYTFINNVTLLLAILAVMSHVAIIATILLYSISYFVKKPIGFIETYKKTLAKNALLIIFIVSLIAVTGSLFFSEYAQYLPCKLCWFQRIFMYPLVIILGLAYFKNKRELLQAVIPLSIIGFLFALYHYAIQMYNTFIAPVPDSLTPCSTGGLTPECTDYYFMYFDYITIPMLSLTAFTIISALALYTHCKKSV